MTIRYHARGNPLPKSTMRIWRLDKGWKVKQADSDDEWLAVSSVPTNIHLDLLANKKIADPVIGLNERDSAWANEKSWIYQVDLPEVDKHEAEPDVTYALSFQGLDTFATVRLNGKAILESSNMFIPHRVDVTKSLTFDGANTLEIEFASAFVEARNIKAQYPDHKWICWNGDPARLAVRKSQYHWGWDWGPILSPCGPWRPVELQSYQGRIARLKIDYTLDKNLEAPDIRIKAFTENCPPGSRVVYRVQRLGDLGPPQNAIDATATVSSNGEAIAAIILPAPVLWWPRGYGDQALYIVYAVLIWEDRILHEFVQPMGFRKVELVRQEDNFGESFFFRINNVDVFCGGSNWIPTDNFLPRVDSRKYEQWLQLLANGNQNMVRVWGGGIYEDKAFYDTCDRLGIMVWQDFMFACGNYPAHLPFLSSVKEEATAVVHELRHHPSVVIFAGNNEDYQIQESENLTYDPSNTDPESWLKTDFPARYIYEHLLPTVMTTEAPTIPYAPGSPFSGSGKLSSDATIGDIHQWNVWHGTQAPYQAYPSLAGRFISEFGMESFPCLDTIESFTRERKELHPQSKTMDAHNKATGSTRRLASYVMENFPIGPTVGIEEWIYLTQLVQSEALNYAYKSWRRQWGNIGERKVGGALVWQLNDCWPGISWSIVDYYLSKKAAYYMVKRCLATVTIGIMREHWDWSDGHKKIPSKLKWECWIANSSLEQKKGRVEVRFVSVATGKDIRGPIILDDVNIRANETTEVLNGFVDTDKDEPHIVSARLWVQGNLVTRDVDWPQPLKYLDLSERGVDVRCQGERDDAEVTILAEKPVKSFVLEEMGRLEFTDNGFDVLPGEPVVVGIKGLGEIGKYPKWWYLGMGDNC